MLTEIEPDMAVQLKWFADNLRHGTQGIDVPLLMGPFYLFNLRRHWYNEADWNWMKNIWRRYIKGGTIYKSFLCFYCIYLEECWHWWKLTLSHCCWDQLLLTCQDCLVDLHGKRSSLTRTSWPLTGRCWQTSSCPHLCQCWLCSNCFLMIQETLLQPKILNILSKWITCMVQVILWPVD